MKQVVLTVGPQYAGKSTFCEKVASEHSNVSIVSRDKILIGMFGTVWLDSYTGGHTAALEAVWREVAMHLRSADANKKTLIVDAWNGPPSERADMVQKLRDLGAKKVVGWHFVTPLPTCLAWSFEKDPIEIKNEWSKIRRDIRVASYTGIHETFCRWDIEKEGVFDAVQRLNALEPPPSNLV